jgi:two-component system sensor histidine kinase CreC
LIQLSTKEPHRELGGDDLDQAGVDGEDLLAHHTRHAEPESDGRAEAEKERDEKGEAEAERERCPLAVAPVSLSALVQSVIDLHEGTAHERGIELRADAKDLSVTGDSRKLKQVLINLVQNALDVAPKGSSVDLVVRSEKAGGAVLVMDRGPGVADAERAFVPGVTSKEHGNGLGLTVSRLVARQHGGDVQLLPREGGGTIAELLLPGAPP